MALSIPQGELRSASLRGGRGWGPAPCMVRNFIMLQRVGSPDSSVATVRFWPALFANAFSTGSPSGLLTAFKPSASYLQILATSRDPYPGAVTSSLERGRGPIKRTWSKNHRFLAIGYFGPKSARSTKAQADLITDSARQATVHVTTPTSTAGAPTMAATLACLSGFYPGTAQTDSTLIGKKVSAAMDLVAAANQTWRIVAHNGICNAVTADLQAGRVDVWVMNGRVVKAVLETPQDARTPRS